MNLVEINEVSLVFRSRRGNIHALDNISFELAKGESLGIVGESGCGKTTVAKTILRLLPKNAEKPDGRVLFRGEDLLSMTTEQIRDIRWRDIALIPQNAMNALDPVYRVGAQIVEAILAHESCSSDAAWERAKVSFAAVGLRPDRIDQYPHQFSGGMRQRAIMAMVLALKPSLIVADEPTTALDVVMQDQVFAEIEQMRKDFDTAVILVSHDIAVVAENCDRVAVMYAGQIVEMGATQAVFGCPEHPYTIGLRNASADIEGDRDGLISIPGEPPELLSPPVGCRFAPRCPFARNKCRQAAPMLSRREDRWVACHFADEAEEFRSKGHLEKTWNTAVGNGYA